MKTTLLTILLALTASQANADGFYQLVVGNSPQSSIQTSAKPTEFSYTPLYNQVVRTSQEIAKQETHGAPTEFTYTPLYQQVVGQPQESKGHRIAGESNDDAISDS